MTGRPPIGHRTSRLPRFALACALLSAAARAEGNGVLLGEGVRLHAAVETEARWDSLAALGAVQTANGQTTNPSDLITHLRPSVRIEAVAPRVRALLSGKLDYSFFAGVSAATQNFTYLGVGAEGGVIFDEARPVSVSLLDRFNRGDTVKDPALGVGTITDLNQLEARLNLRPGGGAIEGGAAYTFGVESYELKGPSNLPCSVDSCNGALYGALGSKSHSLALDARYKFLPKTAFTFDGSIQARVYRDTTVNVPTYPLRLELGLAGLLSERTRIGLKLGYADAFAARGPDFRGPIGQLELGWSAEAVTLTVGASRTLEAVSDVYGWFSDWRLFGRGSMLLLGKLILSGTVRGDYLDFGSRRTDWMLIVEPQVEYEFNQYLRAGLGETFTSRLSGLGDLYTYTRSETFLRATLSY